MLPWIDQMSGPNAGSSPTINLPSVPVRHKQGRGGIIFSPAIIDQ